MAIEAGSDVLLPKPVDTPQLFDLLTQHLALHWVLGASQPPIPSARHNVADARWPRETILSDLLAQVRIANQGHAHPLPSHASVAWLTQPLAQGVDHGE